MKIQTLLASLLLSSSAVAQSPVVKPYILKSPNEFRVNDISANGKWACGVYADDADERYGFLWNLESGEIEMLNPSIPSVAYQVSNNGIVCGEFSDNSYKSNGASMTLAGYWQNGKWNRLELPEGDIVQSRSFSISPDGQYICGNVTEADIYTGYIWKNGKIYKELMNTMYSVPFAMNPDGQSCAGWIWQENRAACIWEADGDVTLLPASMQAPLTYARMYSADGKKLLYYGSWKNFGTQDAEKWGCYGIYDLAAKDAAPVFPVDDEANFDFFGISNNGTVVGENADRAFIYKDGKPCWGEDYLNSLGIDLSQEHILKTEDVDYYQIYRTASVSADDNILGFLYYNDDMNSQGEYSVSVQTMLLYHDYQTTGIAPVSVKALQVAGLNSVLVSWKPYITAQDIAGYNVYRDGEKVNSSLLTAQSFVDANATVGEHKYTVTAVYGNNESAKSEEATVSVVNRPAQAPNSLFALQRGYNNASLTWVKPQTNFGSATYYDSDNADQQGFGLLLKDLNFETAILYDSVKTAAYKGQKITSVGFYPLSEQKSWKVNLYTYDAAGNLKLLYSQPVTQTLNYNEHNDIKLATPVDVPNGDLVVAVEVAVSNPSTNITAVDNAHSVDGYSDLLRLTTEPDFYSIGELYRTEGVLYAATWAIDATIAPEGADLTKDNVDHYDVYVDGNLATSTPSMSYTAANLAKGVHTFGVKAVYANGLESDVKTATANIVPDNSQLSAVENVAVTFNTATSIHASWNVPVDKDNVKVQYCDNEPSDQAVIAPQENNYSMQVGALYPGKTFRGRDGYTISSVRFFPLNDATFTAMLYKDDELVDEVEIEDYTLRTWNEVKLNNPVAVDSKSQYRLVIDCYDVTPQTPPMAVDNSLPVDNYSNIYSLDYGETWNPTTSSAIYANWLIGLNLESTKTMALPVAGYDVNIDGKKKNTEMLTDNKFDYDFTSQDSKEHTISIDTYYTVSSSVVKGGTTTFNIDATGISDNTIGRIELRQGSNVLTVVGNNVASVELFSTVGASVASANGNTLSINGVPAGVYVVKAVVNGETVACKIQIVK